MYSFVFRDLQFLHFLQSSMIACDCRKSKTLRIIYWVASRDKFLLSRPSRRFDRFWETFAISRWTWKSNQGWARLAWGSFRESPPFETRLKREPSWTKEETWWNFKNMKVTFNVWSNESQIQHLMRQLLIATELCHHGIVEKYPVHAFLHGKPLGWSSFMVH